MSFFGPKINNLEFFCESVHESVHQVADLLSHFVIAVTLCNT